MQMIFPFYQIVFPMNEIPNFATKKYSPFFFCGSLLAQSNTHKGPSAELLRKCVGTLPLGCGTPRGLVHLTDLAVFEKGNTHTDGHVVVNIFINHQILVCHMFRQTYLRILPPQLDTPLAKPRRFAWVRWPPPRARSTFRKLQPRGQVWCPLRWGFHPRMENSHFGVMMIDSSKLGIHSYTWCTSSTAQGGVSGHFFDI